MFEASHSAFFVRVSEFPEAITDGFAETEATEEPVIGVSAIMIYGSAITLVVAAALPGQVRSPFGVTIRLRGLM